MAPHRLFGVLLAVLLGIAAGKGKGTCDANHNAADNIKTSALLQSKMQQNKAALREDDSETGETEAMGDLGAPVSIEQALVDLQAKNNAYRNVDYSDLAGATGGWLKMNTRYAGGSVAGKNVQNMFDNDMKTHGGAKVIIIDLGQEYHVNQLRIVWRICRCARKRSMDLLHSQNGKQWGWFKSIGGFYVEGGSEMTFYDNLNLPNTRYLAVKPKKTPLKYADIWEFAVFGTMGLRKPNVYGWYQSYKAGSNGLSGTEMIHLEPYKGSLFGGTGYWMHKGSFRAAEVVRLDKPFSNWAVETQVNQYAGRTETLKAIQWTTDHKGNKLATPDDRLHAGFYLNWVGEGRCITVVRDDATKKWAEEIYWRRRPFKKNYLSARALKLFQDPVTGVDMLFYVTGMDGINVGVYVPTRASKVGFRQGKRTESGRVGTRPLALAVLDNRIYFTASSYMMRRTNGPRPRWTKVFDMADHDKENTVDEAVGGLRGITTISNAASPVGQSLLFAWAPNANSKGCMVRLDPDGDGFKWTEEKCVQKVEADHLGKNNRGQKAITTYVIADYNFVLEIASDAHLIGFEVLLYSYTAFEFPIDPKQLQVCSSGKRLAYKGEAGYMVRRGPGSYEAREPGGPRYDPQDIFPAQTAVRSMALSPFNDGAVYMGGYDCNHFDSLNTAWVQRGEAAAVWKEPVKCQKEKGCTGVPGAPWRPLGCDWWPHGSKFIGESVAGFRGKEPVICQTLLDYINSKGAGMCGQSKKWPAAKLCSEVDCDLCAGRPGQFQSGKSAGKDASGNPYDCGVALDYIKGGNGISCQQGRNWFSSVCCG